jgi:hypothetical protein
MSDARKVYRDFRGRNPARETGTGVRFGSRWLTAPGSLNILIPESMAVIGHVNAIEYDSTRDGPAVFARHDFAPGSRPILAAGSGRGQIFLIGTRYHFTERGIVDIDSAGRDILDHKGLSR